MPAWCMEGYPETVESILKAGHEIGHHSWQYEDPALHSDEIEEGLFTRACDTLVRMTGRMPRGYRAPVYSSTQAMLDRLID
jgi:peptidoglycan/xylan/chitin deacetylase (PgdA/CDA1 family)